jgi:hypothetical protein
LVQGALLGGRERVQAGADPHELLDTRRRHREDASWYRAIDVKIPQEAPLRPGLVSRSISRCFRPPRAWLTVMSSTRRIWRNQSCAGSVAW